MTAPVNAIAGTEDSAGFARIRRISSKPSISGIPRSETITSGRARSSAVSAALAFGTASTLYPRHSSSICKRQSTSSESSTSKTRFMTRQFAIMLPVVTRNQFRKQHSGKFTQQAAGYSSSDETSRNKFLILHHRPIGRPRAMVARAVGGKVDGSPVRGPEKDPIIRLNESTDLQTFQAELIRLVKTDVKHAEILFSYVENRSRSLSLPMWIQSHLEKHPGLRHRLDDGEMVGFSNVEDGPVREQVNGGPSSVVLVPIVSDATLHAVIGLVSAVKDPQPSAEDIESVRQLAHVAAPILVRLCTIEKLRTAVEERNALQVFAQMRSHLEANIAHDLR